MSLVVMLLVLGPIASAPHHRTFPSFQDQFGAPTVIRKEYDMRRLAAPPAQPEAVLKGRKLWVQRCAHCHDGLGQPSSRTLGPSLGAETITSRGEDRVRKTISIGSERMPGFQYALRPAQLDQLVAFLKSVTADQRTDTR